MNLEAQVTAQDVLGMELPCSKYILSLFYSHIFDLIPCMLPSYHEPCPVMILRLSIGSQHTELFELFYTKIPIAQMTFVRLVFVITK